MALYNSHPTEFDLAITRGKAREAIERGKELMKATAELLRQSRESLDCKPRSPMAAPDRAPNLLAMPDPSPRENSVKS